MDIFKDALYVEDSVHSCAGTRFQKGPILKKNFLGFVFNLHHSKIDYLKTKGWN